MLSSALSVTIELLLRLRCAESSPGEGVEGEVCSGEW